MFNGKINFMQTVDGVSFGVVILFISLIVLLVYLLLGLYNDMRLKFLDTIIEDKSKTS